jgi:ABC-type branched-subunit amino acid transport system ATPase component
MALACAELTKRYGGFVAVENVSLAVPLGDIVGIAAPNGAGKTPLLDVVSGHRRADRGRVELGNKDVTRLPSRADLIFIPQEDTLGRTLIQNRTLVEGRLDRVIRIRVGQIAQETGAGGQSPGFAQQASKDRVEGGSFGVEG